MTAIPVSDPSILSHQDSGESLQSSPMVIPRVDLETGSATDPGRKRKNEPNQDALSILPADSARPPLFVVADGMGGYAGGAEASRLVIESVLTRYRQKEDYSDLSLLLRNCILQAHQAISHYVKEHANLSSMGSTAVLAAVTDKEVFVANIGDSRAYRLHGNEMTLLSYDHSIVADQVRAGSLTFLEALRSPKRNRLTQSITPKRKTIDPFVHHSVFGGDDTLMLCTDGLWGVVTEAIIRSVVRELAPQAAADKLVALSLARGAPDNITVVIARRQTGQSPIADEEDKTNPGLY